MTKQQQKELIEKEFSGDACPWIPEVYWCQDEEFWECKLRTKRNTSLTIELHFTFISLFDRLLVDVYDGDFRDLTYLPEVIQRKLIEICEILKGGKS